MITKERLDELIRQGATVWSNSLKEEVNLKNCLGLTKDRNKLILKIREFEGFISYYDVDYLEEDVETAKFKDNYQNITRTETLSLPTWEEIENDYIEPNIILFHRFMKKDNTEAELVVDCFDNKIEVLGVGGAYNIWEATKENYLEACELCKKLFLGEEE